MSAVLIAVLILLLLILANGGFAMAEIAMVSARDVRLEERAKDGRAGADRALELRGSLGRFLSTIQVGITLVGVLSGAFGGVSLAKPIAAAFEGVPLVHPYRQTVALGIVVLVITYLTLILGELAPKRIALHNPELIASLVARPMTWIEALAGPVVRFLTWSTDMLVALIGIRGDGEPSITEEEIKALMERGLEEGIFVPQEQALIERVFQLEERRVGSVCTPRAEITWLDLEEGLESTKARILTSAHSYLPVIEGDLDHVVGIVKKEDLLELCLTGAPLDLERVLRKVEFVPESMKALELLARFKEQWADAALVMDEYGGLEGLVTTDNMLEGLVGDVPVPGGLRERPVQREDGSWLLDGMTPLEEFKDLFELEHVSGEERALFETLGGFVMAQCGGIPSAGDRVNWEGMKFEVADMDGLRVDKVIVWPKQTRATE